MWTSTSFLKGFYIWLVVGNQEGFRKIKDVFEVFQRVLPLVAGGDGRAGRLVGHLRTLGVQQHLEDRQRGTTGDLFRSETTPRSTCGGGFRAGLS